jgi:hypothetical protein
MSFAVPVPLLFLQLRFIHRIDPQFGELPAKFDDPAGVTVTWPKKFAWIGESP